MTLLIPYTDDRRNGHELRYAIRSMVKHYLHLTGVCLIGDKPTWYAGEHIPAKDIPKRKEWSIVSKILMSPHENFLFSYDDVFAMQYFIELPNYYSETLSKVKLTGKYIDRAANVRSIYPDGLFYDIHAPMFINLAAYEEANKVAWSEREYLCKSLYGNFMGGGQKSHDVKLRSISDKIPDGVPFFSTTNSTARFAKLETLYPEPCQYER